MENYRDAIKHLWSRIRWPATVLLAIVLQSGWEMISPTLAQADWRVVKPLLDQAAERRKAGDYVRAAELAQQAMSRAEGGGKAYVHNELGFIFADTKQYEKALGHFDEAFRGFENLGRAARPLADTALVMKGVVYLNMKNLQKTIEIRDELSRRGGDPGYLQALNRRIEELDAELRKKRAAREEMEQLLQQAAEAEKQGLQRDAFKYYMAALAAGEIVDPTNIDRGVVENIVVLARTLEPHPAVPEGARRQAVYAHTALKEAKDASGFNAALREYSKAIRQAPWWGDLYLNTGLLLEQTGHFADAITSLQLFLLAAPNDPDAEKVRTKIYELEYKAKQQEKK